MNEPASVCVREPGRDLGRDPRRLASGSGSARLQPLLERAVRQVLEHHERLSVRLAVVVERAEVRVRERRGRARLALEARAVGGRREQLDGDATVELRSPRPATRSSSPRGRVARSAGSALRSARRSSRLIIVIRSGGPPDDRRGARARARAGSRPLAAESVPIAAPRRRVLARRRSRRRRPAAVRQLGDGRLRRARGRHARAAAVVGHSAAGRPELAGRSRRGEAIAISTGAVVPAGRRRGRPRRAHEPREGSAVAVERVGEGDNRRPRGGDVRAGDVVVRGGHASRPAADRRAGGRRRRRGAVRAAARGRPCSRPAPSCALPGEPLGPGEIYESNTLALCALSSSPPAPRSSSSIRSPTTTGATRAALDAGLDGDVLITSGGVSVGAHDLVRGALAELGVEEIFWRVAVRPGKPVAFGVARRDARLRAAGQPGLGARRLRALRAPGDARAAGSARSRRRSFCPAASPRRCGRTTSATSSSARGRASSRPASCSSRSPARSRT